MSKVLLVSGNAGQGKTTVAKNIAFALRNFGFNVLLVDSDLKTPKLCHHVGMPLVARTIQSVLLGSTKLEDAIYLHASGLKLLLSSLTSVDVPHPSKLLPKLKRLADVIIIDVPCFDKEWYNAGCETLLVAHPDFPSMIDIQRLSKQTKVTGLILNRAHDDHIDLSIGNIQQIITTPILGVIPDDTAIREALRHGYAIVEYNPEIQASNVLKQIAAKLMNLEYYPVKKTTFLEKIGLK